jgi:ADP-ribose pyrophosphatase
MPNDQKVDIASIKKTLIHEGMVWDLVSDTFEFNGALLTREYVDHTGAVAVLAFNEKE